MLAVMGLFGTAGSMLAIGVAALANAAHSPGFAGLEESVMAIGAVACGLFWGRCHPGWSWSRSVSTLLVPWAVLVAAAAIAGLGVPMLGLLLLAGAAGAPLWTLAYLAGDQAVPETVRTEANTWITTVSNLGTTAGTAVSGVLSSVAIQLPLFSAAGLAAVAGLAMAVLARVFETDGPTDD